MKKTISQPSLILLVASQLSFGATFTVTNTEDKGSGSLRQAILDANQTVEADTFIEFKIPGLGPYTIRPASALPAITAPVTIDATTQPGFAGQPIIELDGTRVTTQQAAGLRLAAGNCTVRGLVINRFNAFGSAAIWIPGSSGNVIQGNFIGTDMTGKRALANWNGLFVDRGSSDNVIGGTTPGARNVISRSGNGIWLSGSGNLVQGNFIGTDVTGTVALGNAVGIGMADSSSNTIGGTSEGARNIISGNNPGPGIYLGIREGENVIQGNFIGTDASGRTALGNKAGGIVIERGARDNTIGGPTPGSGNTIAFNGGPGVFFRNADAGTGNAIRGNSIFGNAGLGIDFGSGLIKKNDAGDTDTGPNGLQNFPVLTSAVGIGNDVTVQGTLQSSANAVFNLDFFLNPVCSAAGIGQGQNFSGSVSVTTDANGDANFNATFPTSVATGPFITATATDADNNTSQFSPCAQVMERAPFPTLVVSRPGSADSLILSWPSSSPGFVLETTDNLAPAALWLRVADVPSVSGDQNRVTIKTSSRSGFYRLRKP